MSKGAKSGIADKKITIIGDAFKFHKDEEPPLVKNRGGMLQEQDGVLASGTVCRISVALSMEQSGTQTQTNRDGANDYAAASR